MSLPVYWRELVVLSNHAKLGVSRLWRAKLAHTDLMVYGWEEHADRRMYFYGAEVFDMAKDVSGPFQTEKEMRSAAMRWLRVMDVRRRLGVGEQDAG